MTHRLRAAGALIAGLLASPLAWAQVAAPTEDSIVTQRLIVKYRGGAGPQVSERSQRALGAATSRRGLSTRTLRRMADGAHVLQLSRTVSVQEARTVAQGLRASDPDIEYAEPDLLLQTAQAGWSPADPLYNQQWHLFDATAGIRAPGAWSMTRGAGVVVAVIDTGVLPHPDLMPNLVAGVDFISDPAVAADGGGRDSNAADPGDGAPAGACGSGSPATRSSWHGTHVAGIVAASSNAVGVTGVAPAAKVLPLRALGRCGGYTSDIADAITWAAGGSVAGIAANRTPARVINLSLGGRASCPITLHNAIQSARARGAVVVAAAGNSNTDAAGATPANCSGVIAVAATGPTGAKASYSNTGVNVTLAAPGGDGTAGILSTANAGLTTPGQHNYLAYKGTSMAAPVVAGAAALLLSARPSLTPDQVAALLKSTAAPFGGACTRCGSGIVDASAAVAAVAGTPALPPSPPPAPTSASTGAASAPGALREAEPNNSIGMAQNLGSAAADVSASLTVGDQDHYRVTIAAGRKLTATVKPSALTAAGLSVLLPDGRQLVSMPGSAGASRSVVVNNVGRAPVEIVLRVSLTRGKGGTYALSVRQ